MMEQQHDTMSEERALSLGLKPLALSKLRRCCTGAKMVHNKPSTLPKALDKAGIALSDVEYFEFNEAFAVVGLANSKILGLDNDKVNVMAEPFH
jgi:acetyl-CoA C-acetyltransferase